MLRPDPSLVPGYEQNRALVRAIVLLAVVVFGGTVGFIMIEGWEPWRALFFTLITITTVGYGDEGISEEGKKFATLLLVGGIGVASYTFAMIVQTAITSQLAWRKRMQKRIYRLSGHTIVCGFGRMGRTVCDQLSSVGVPFVVVEPIDAPFRSACELGFMAVQGSASDDNTLVRAGIEFAQHVVSVVPRESDSIVIALSARELREDLTIIARAETDEGVRKLILAGADRIVSPYQSGGVDIANLITRPRTADLLARATLEGSDVALTDILVQESSPLVGKTLGDYGRRLGTRISFVAMERPGYKPAFPAKGSIRLRAGDRLIVAGDPEQVARMRDLAGRPRRAA